MEDGSHGDSDVQVAGLRLRIALTSVTLTSPGLSLGGSIVADDIKTIAAHCRVTCPFVAYSTLSTLSQLDIATSLAPHRSDLAAHVKPVRLRPRRAQPASSSVIAAQDETEPEPANF